MGGRPCGQSQLLEEHQVRAYTACNPAKGLPAPSSFPPFLPATWREVLPAGTEVTGGPGLRSSSWEATSGNPAPPGPVPSVEKALSHSAGCPQTPAHSAHGQKGFPGHLPLAGSLPQCPPSGHRAPGPGSVPTTGARGPADLGLLQGPCGQNGSPGRHSSYLLPLSLAERDARLALSGPLVSQVPGNLPAP